MEPCFYILTMSMFPDDIVMRLTTEDRVRG